MFWCFCTPYLQPRLVPTCQFYCLISFPDHAHGSSTVTFLARPFPALMAEADNRGTTIGLKYGTTLCFHPLDSGDGWGFSWFVFWRLMVVLTQSVITILELALLLRDSNGQGIPKCSKGHLLHSAQGNRPEPLSSGTLGLVKVASAVISVH